MKDIQIKHPHIFSACKPKEPFIPPALELPLLLGGLVLGFLFPLFRSMLAYAVLSPFVLLTTLAIALLVILLIVRAIILILPPRH